MAGQVLHFFTSLVKQMQGTKVVGWGKEKEVSAEWKRLAVCCAVLLTADISQDVYYHVSMSSRKF